jgi:hypothetical protein
MPGWRRIVSLAAVLLALMPAAAFAQSAGDEQYQDPFQGQGQATPTATPAPAQPTQAPAAPAGTAAPAAPPAAPPAAAAAPAQAAQLPRTGWDAAIPGVCGLILLSAGGVLRTRVRRDA